MANSINTNISAYFAQSNIAKASTAAQTSVGRLSSGNFITKASDDVARLSIGTSFSTAVRTLRQALVNASQGVSLLQVADGALGQVTEILQRQKTLSIQASSGNLSNSDRGFLNQEFQALSQQIDFITSTTNFNGVSLIDGGLSKAAAVNNAATAATSGALTISFSNAIADGEVITINGVDLTAETDTSVTDYEFAVGSTIQETVENLAARLNLLATDNSVSGVSAANRLLLSEAKYTASGNSLIITSRTGGSLSETFRVSGTATGVTNGEASFAGKYVGTSFNLFTDASSSTITTSSYVLSDTGGSATTDPFNVGESLKITIDGTERTLFTFTSGGGSGTSGAYTVQDLVNGINATSSDTGVKAALVYNGTSYNVRLSYESLTGVAVLDGGDTYHSGTFKLTGDNIDKSDTAAVVSGATVLATSSSADASKSIVFAHAKTNLFATAVVSPTNVASATATVATGTLASVGTATPFFVGDTVRATVNGQVYTLHTVAAGDGLDDIVKGINAKVATTGIYAALDTGTTGAIQIKLYSSDPSGQAGLTTVGLSLDTGANTDSSAAEATGSAMSNTPSTGLLQYSNYALKDAADNGLGVGDTVISGTPTIGDTILTAISQNRASSRVLLTQNAANGNTLTFGDKVFYFTTTTSGRSPNQILIGDTIAETLDNAVATLNNYLLDGYAFGSEAYELNQVDITRDGDALVFTGKKLGNVLQSDGTAVAIDTNVTNASKTSANLSNAATTFGVRVDGISNSAFAGKIQGFKVDYTGTSDTVDISVKIGDFTYKAKNVDITQSSNTTIRLLSDEVGGKNGGYFDIQLRGGEVTAVTSQGQANTVASRLDAAFSSLSFLQTRNVTSYSAGGSFSVGGTITGSLLGTKLTAQLADFNNLKLTDITVSAPSGSATDAVVKMTINGVVYTSANGIGDTLGANHTYRLTSAADPDQYLDFTTGDTAIVLDSAAKAAAFQNALEGSFGFTEGSSALSFQIGIKSADSLSVSIGSATTKSLFDGVTLSINTAENAQAASTALDKALATITSIRANVGALQSRFNFASANIQISVQNQDASRSELLDTDIASESTSYATAQVQLQAGISVLAQANQQLQSLLKLLG